MVICLFDLFNLVNLLFLLARILHILSFAFSILLFLLLISSRIFNHLNINILYISFFLSCCLFFQFLFSLDTLHLVKHFIAQKLKIALVVNFIARVAGKNWQTIIAKNIADDLFLFVREKSWLWSINWLFKTQVDLKFTFAENLNQFLETTGDIVCIRKLIKLALYLLCCIETQFLVAAHGRVIRISIFVSADQQIDIMANSPPNGWSLTVEHRRW